MPKRPRIVVLGRQGAGKGTQCARLAAHLRVPHISTGDLFRLAVREGSPVGREVAAILDHGGLVPDDLVIDVVREHAATTDMMRAGYLLDGFPRTVAQAEAFFIGGSATIDLTGAPCPGLDVAIEITVPVDVVVDRISKRRVCPIDGWITTVEGPTTTDVRCPDGHVAVQRNDDRPEPVRRRLALYDLETGPLSPWFELRGQLARVDGTGSADAVFARICAALEPYLARLPAPATG